MLTQDFAQVLPQVTMPLGDHTLGWPLPQMTMLWETTPSDVYSVRRPRPRETTPSGDPYFPISTCFHCVYLKLPSLVYNQNLPIQYLLQI